MMILRATANALANLRWPSELLRAKRSKIPLVAFPGAEQLPLHLVLGLSRAEIVVDALPTTPLGGLAALERCKAVLRSGMKLVLASKDALAVSRRRSTEQRASAHTLGRLADSEPAGCRAIWPTWIATARGSPDARGGA